MSRSINLIAQDIFGDIGSSSRYLNYRRGRDSFPLPKVFLEIPIKGEEFELPTFVMRVFPEVKRFPEKDVVTVELRTLGRTPDHKTLTKYLTYTLTSKYTDSYLVETTVETSEEAPKTYFMTNGAIFNEALKPLMMCLWKVRHNADTNMHELIKPIVRIDPECFVSRKDPIEKFIVNKLPLLAMNFSPPSYVGFATSRKLTAQDSISARVEIDECPFRLKRPDTPSFSTTDGKLLQTVLNHIDDVV